MHAFSHIFIAAAVTTANVQLLFQITKIEFLLKLEWWNWSGEEIFDNLEILTSEAGLEELMNKYSKRDAIN